MRSKKFLTVVLIFAFIFTGISGVYADATSEAILKLLIKKGILTQKEVNDLKSEVSKSKPSVPGGIEARVERLEEKQFEMPAWVRDLKIKGDLRLRNEFIDNEDGQDNNRQRVRFRLGAVSKLNDKVKIGFGLASGSSDSPTSTNQTLEQEFQSKQIWLDYAYASYNPYSWLHLIGGKFKSPFFHTDMLWDSDIRFDGFAGKLTHNLNPEGRIPTSAYLTLGGFPIDDVNDAAGDDIYLFVGQVGTESKFADGSAKLKTGVTYYDFANIQGATTASLAEDRGTNTVVGGVLQNDYNTISPIAKLSFKDIFGVIDVPWGVLAEYANNLAASSDEEAYRAGLWLGKSKVKKKNDWKLLGQYTRLEKDAFLDSFPDSDFNKAGTDGKGWEFIFNYGLADNIIFSVDYYNTSKISSGDSDQQIIQTDLIFKF